MPRIKEAVKWLAGQRTGHVGIVGVDRLVRNWNYTPSRPDHLSAFRRRRLAKNARPAPDSVALKPAGFGKRWVVYFIYAPDGKLTPGHRFTLLRLSGSGARLLVVFSSPSIGEVPSDLSAMVDALYWKALPGFDFSGYAIALHALAQHSAGCDVLVMNDSVFGPFGDPDDLWALQAWDLTGFTASSSIENHLQSYAFMLKDWNPARLRGLGAIFPRATCFNSYEDVVFCQESRFARMAAKTMTVGSLWYVEHTQCLDIPVYAAVSLAHSGFPFVKRSLFTKHADAIGADAAIDLLVRHGHPLP